MRRRHLVANIPTEVARTLCAIAETGSYTKAGSKLGLSQPAITAQVKRLQIMVGGPVFERSSTGIVLTDRGTLVLGLARRLIDANDQIIAVGGGVQEKSFLRVGLTPLYVEDFLSLYAPRRHDLSLSFYCDMSSDIIKGVEEGYMDVGCVVSPPPEVNNIVASWDEEFVWVRSADFVLSPGAPVPVIISPGSTVDVQVVQSLEKVGLLYRVVFTGADHHARFMAVAAGIGLTQLPRRQVKPPLRVAEEYYLPPACHLKGAILLRPNIDRRSIRDVIDLLMQLAPAPGALH